MDPASGAPTDASSDGFRIPKYWPRCWALDVDRTRASVLWAAHDPEGDVLYLYSEIVVPRYDLTQVADAIRSRSHGYPGLFDHLARGRAPQEGQRIIGSLLDLNLDLFTPQVDRDAAVAETMHRLATRRLKAFAASCPQWLQQYRSYRRDEKGEIASDQPDGLMRAMDLIVMEGPGIAGHSEEVRAAAEDDWMHADRDPVTGY
jgi:hypothetical protein